VAGSEQDHDRREAHGDDREKTSDEVQVHYSTVRLHSRTR
jgi:hypothetical protein